jgi:hypothetical protein
LLIPLIRRYPTYVDGFEIIAFLDHIFNNLAVLLSGKRDIMAGKKRSQP